VSYRQFYVESRPGEFGADPSDACAGQSNGLCGAAVPGYLFLTTGLHTGTVGLTVEVHDSPPPLGESWEEVVEVSFRPESPSTVLLPWGDGPLCALELPVAHYRVRYCGRGMDQAEEEELAVLAGEGIVDHYLLQFWLAVPGTDQVIRQTSRSADYWHPHPSAASVAAGEGRGRASPKGGAGESRPGGTRACGGPVLGWSPAQ
jgi:hypothetical protein